MLFAALLYANGVSAVAAALVEREDATAAGPAFKSVTGCHFHGTVQ